MSGFSDLFQKAVYLGVGLASYAGEKAGTKLTELRAQAQKLADELVARGEMTTEEARRMVRVGPGEDDEDKPKRKAAKPKVTLDPEIASYYPERPDSRRRRRRG